MAGGFPILQGEQQQITIAELALDDPGLDHIPLDDEVGLVDAHILRAWAHAFLPARGWHGPVRSIAARAATGAVVGFAAFAWQRLGRFDLLSLGGYYWPWRGIVLGQAELPKDSIADALAAHLTDLSPPLAMRLGPLSTEDANTAAFVAAMQRQGWRGIRRDVGEAHQLNIPASPEALNAGVSASLLKNLSYLRRRLDKQAGPVRTVRHVLQGEGVQVLLSRVAQVEERTWVAARGGDTKFIGEANAKFWAALACAPARAAQVVIWLLSCGGKDVAFSAHIETKQNVWIIANGFDEAWKAHSPGSLLTQDVFSDAIAHGKRRVDWGQGDSGYKSRWGALPSAKVFDVILLRPGAIGAALGWIARRVSGDWNEL